jgi:hypothetical protein
MNSDLAFELGKSKRRPQAELDAIFVAAHSLFRLSCVPELMRPSEDPAQERTWPELFRLIQELRPNWLQVFHEQGRPRAPSAPVQDSLLSSVGDLVERFKDVRTDAVKPYEREFGARVWNGNQARQRLLNPHRFKRPVDHRAREVLRDAGMLPLVEDEQTWPFLRQRLREEPTVAAMTVGALIAQKEHGFRGGWRKFYDRYRQSRSPNPA